MSSIVIESPTRVDLAGGTIDLWPLYNFVGHAITINVAIDVMTKVVLTPRQDQKITLESLDLKLKKEYDHLNAALADVDQRMLLLQTQLKFWQPNLGFDLVTSSQSPVGGGLGGSSSLTISLLKAFALFLNRPFKDIHQMVHVAHNLEAEILGTPTGTQDYYPAASGGVNILKYSTWGIEQEVLDIPLELNDYFMLIYTGKSHHSGMNNFAVMTDAVAKDNNTLNCLKELRDIAIDTVCAVKEKKFHLIPDCFRREYSARVRLAPEFSSPEIEKLAELSLQNGADAVKICGAGGGGCVLVWCAPQNQSQVRDACHKAGFQVMPTKLISPLKSNDSLAFRSVVERQTKPV